MNINWVPKKSINNETVNNLLIKNIELNQFTNGGPNVKYLEEFIKNKFLIDDNKSVIVVTNGAVALHSLVSAINYVEKKNIEWVTQSFTFPPSAQSTLSNVKIIDIDLNGGLDINCIDDNIEGLIVTNIFGNVVDIDKYIKFCKDNNKFLIFDNAATAYTFYNGTNCLNYGNGCTISFHHTKPFGFAEGGAIIVDKKYEYTIRCLNNFGINLTDCYWVNFGNNYKMSEISAVYILQFLIDNFDNIIKTHNELYNYFKNKISNITHIKLFPSFHSDIIVPSCFSILVDKYSDIYISTLNENNIVSRKYYHPLKYTQNAVKIYNSIVCIPCTIDMDCNDIDNIITIISSIKHNDDEK